MAFWSLLAPLALDVGKSIMAGNAAASSAAAANYQAMLQQRQADAMNRAAAFNTYMANQQLWKEDQDVDYYNDQYLRNSAILQDYARRQGDYYANELGILAGERGFEINRQGVLDRDAAAQRAFQLGQLLQNQNLSAAEREQALSMLYEARAVAERERGFDEAQLSRNQGIAEGERAFDIARYYQDRNTAQGERDFEIGRQNEIAARINDYANNMQRVSNELGQLNPVHQFTIEDILAEEQRRADLNIADVDRAANRVASISEADLIRKGMDLSTAGEMRRGEITRQIADQYSQARARARDEAIAYITGAQGMLNNQQGAEIQRRNTILGEADGVNQAGISQLLQLRPAPSAMIGDRNFSSAVIDPRIFSSANNFSSPLDVRTAIYDNMNIGGNYSNYNVNTSGVSNSYLNLNTGVNPYSLPQRTGPGGYLSAATNMYGQANNIYTSNANNANDRAAGNANAFGSALGDLTDNLFNDRWSDFSWGDAF